MPTRLYVGSGAWDGAEDGVMSSWAFASASGLCQPVGEWEVGGLPSFLCYEPTLGMLYAADEGRGGVLETSLDHHGRLQGTVHRQDSHHPVYVSFCAEPRQLLTANYVEGAVAIYDLDEAGRVTHRTQSIATGAKTHCVLPVRSDACAYAVSTGADVVVLLRRRRRDWVLDEAGTIQLEGGPRHLVFDRIERFAYVSHEYEDRVSVLERDASGGLTLRQTVGRLPPGQAADPLRDSGADAVIGLDGRHLYVSNRGRSNTIALFDVNPRSGLLENPRHVSTEGEIPRKVAIHPSGRWLVAANRVSRTLAVFEVDADTGSLSLQDLIDVPGSPFFVMFAQY